MQSTLTPKPNDDPHDVVVVAPDAVRVAPSHDEIADLLHEAAARHRPDAQSGAGSDVPAGPVVPAVDTTFRASAVNDVGAPGKGWSMARGALRAFTALLVAGCIGLAALAWRTYGDAAEKKIAEWTTQFVLTVSLPSEKPDAPPDAPPVAADAAPSQPASPAETAAPAVPSADPAQLQSMSRDLASLGQQVEQLKASIEQLKVGQPQTSRDVVKASEIRPSEAKASEIKASEVKASEPNARPKISALPPRPAVARPRKPMPSYPPPQAAATPALPPATAPYPVAAPYYPPRQTDYIPRQVEPQPPVAVLTDPELSSVPRPPMPVR